MNDFRCAPDCALPPVVRNGPTGLLDATPAEGEGADVPLSSKPYVPLSVRHGNRRKRLRWWWQCRKEAVAFRMCPWLKSHLHERESPREGLCEDCRREYAVWFAPNELWNRIVREHYPNGHEPYLCPSCFAIRAEQQGEVPTAWVLTEEKTA